MLAAGNIPASDSRGQKEVGEGVIGLLPCPRTLFAPHPSHCIPPDSCTEIPTLCTSPGPGIVFGLSSNTLATVGGEFSPTGR